MHSDVQYRKESELVTAILAGDPQLYHQLIRPYERGVYFISLYCVREEKRAEYVARAAFLEAFCNLHSFRHGSKFGPWVLRIAVKEARRQSEGHSNYRPTSSDEFHADEIPIYPALIRDWKGFPLNLVESANVRKSIRQALAMLPDVCQQVFFLCEAEALTVSDTAQVLDLDISRVKAVLQCARMMVQRFLVPALTIQDEPNARLDPT